MRIAFVCDAEIAIALFARLARDFGHDVVAVSGSLDPDAADDDLIGSLERAAPDAVLLDGRRGDPLGRRDDGPGRLGATIARIRAAYPRVRIGVVGALGETELLRVATATRVDFLVPRPFVRSGVALALARLTSEPEGLRP